jgi:hypothetical protein
MARDFEMLGPRRWGELRSLGVDQCLAAHAKTPAISVVTPGEAVAVAEPRTLADAPESAAPAPHDVIRRGCFGCFHVGHASCG